MIISVEHINTSGVISNEAHYISRAAIFKHLAVAGQGYAPRPQTLFRTLGMFLHYSYYLQRAELNNNRFSTPPAILSDPTEQGQFSNLIGKAIADFLSKKINKSLYTVNYEAVASRPLRGKRPDLVAFGPNSIFTIEAKGRYQSNPGNMAVHKRQAASGTYPRNFSIASVSYNLFREVKCKYHDPFNDNIPYDNETLQRITQKYYSGLRGFINDNYFSYSEQEFNGEQFYVVELSYRNFERILSKMFPPRIFWFLEFLDYYRPSIILPKRIIEYATHGVTNEIKPFSFDVKENDTLYIDNDRVGLQIERW